MAVMLDVRLCGFGGMMCGVMKMPLGCVSVMCCRFVVIRLMVFCGLPMMAGSVVMMFSGFVMVFSSLLRHFSLLDLTFEGIPGRSENSGLVLLMSDKRIVKVAAFDHLSGSRTSVGPPAQRSSFCNTSDVRVSLPDTL